MAEEEDEEYNIPEDEAYDIFEEEYVPPRHPQLERIKRQLFACSSTLLGALAFGICSSNYMREYMVYVWDLRWSSDYVFWQPWMGDAPGIILAVPLLYFFGRRYALIVSQLFFLGTLLVKQYFHEQQTAMGVQLRLPEEFLCVIVLHTCVRTNVVVTVVYVTEVAQPSFRGPLLAAFFPFFNIGLYIGRFTRRPEKVMLFALIAQTTSFLLALVAPESPYWQALKGDSEGAHITFRRLRGGEDDAEELAAILENFSPDVEHPPLLPAFGMALAKMVFLYMGTDSICRVFMLCKSLPSYFFRYDNAYEHEINDDQAVPRWFMYPIFGSIAFMLVCPFVGRRILYLISICVTFIIFYARSSYITISMEDARVRSANLCYFTTHMGATQVVLLVSGEIFPGKLREFGVAICELMQLGLQYADYKWAECVPQLGSNYSTLRLILIPLGLIMTLIFLPETRNKTLIEAETAGGEMVAMFKPKAIVSEEQGPDEENVE